MKKLITIFTLVVLFLGSAWGQPTGQPAGTFSVQNAEGKWIVYKIIDGTNEVEVAAPNENSYQYPSKVVIPATINHPTNGNVYTVTQIGSHAFHKQRGAQHIFIPSTVDYIEDNAFYNMRNRDKEGWFGEYFYLPKDNHNISLYSLSDSAPSLLDNDCTKGFWKGDRRNDANGDTYKICGTDERLNNLYYPQNKDYSTWTGRFHNSASIPTHTFTLNPNGGTYTGITTTSFKVCSGYSVKAEHLPVPTRTGYTFTGWKIGTTAFTGSRDNWSSDVNCVAQWEANEYTLTYDLNATITNLVPVSQTVTFDAAVGELAQPERDGYNFAGWKIGSTPIDANYVWNVANNQTAVAQWKAIRYQLSFNYSDGIGTAIPHTTVTYDQAIGTLPIPTSAPAGYYFLNWKIGERNIDHGTIWDYISSQTANTVWAGNQYDVAFDKNGGVGTMTVQELTYGEPQTLTPNPFTKNGYHFIGWNREADGSGAAVSTATVAHNLTTVANEEVTIYAQWEANSYTVVFNGNGATSGTMENQGFTYDESQNLTENDFQKTGYAFIGWGGTLGGDVDFEDEESVRNLTGVENESVTLYAIWTETYTLTWKSNEETFATSTLYNGQAITLPTGTPTFQGYDFSGWKIDGGAIPATYTYSENKTAEAQWTPKQITLDPIAVTGTNAKANVGSIIVYDLSTIMINNDAAAGIVTYSSSELPSGMNITAAGEVTGTPTAVAASTAYTIQITGKNGTSATVELTFAILPTKPVAYIAQGTTSGDAPTDANYYAVGDGIIIKDAGSLARTGHSFAGWSPNSTENINIPLFITGSTFTLPALPPTPAINFYSKWTPKTYTVTFHLNTEVNGGGATAPQTFTYGVEDALTTNGFTKTGYHFAGWATSETGEAVYADEAGYQIDNANPANDDLYAVWEANTNTNYTVNYFLQNINDDLYTLEETLNLEGTTDAQIPEASLKAYVGFTAPARSTEIVAANGSTIITYQYTRNKYDVTYAIDATKGTLSTPSTFADVKFEAATPAAPTVTPAAGYQFNNVWSPERTATVIADDVTYTAQLSTIEYTITYNLDGGTNAVGNPTIYNVETPNITLEEPSRTGYGFAGWFDLENQEVETIEQGSTGNITLYAKWTPKTYTITINHNDGTANTTEVTATYDAVLPTFTAVTKTGYSLNGYFEIPENIMIIDAAGALNAAASTYANADGKWIYDDNATFQAQWTANTYEITLDYTMGGTGDASVTATYDAVLPEISEPTKTGNDFKGYYDAAIDGMQVIDATRTLVADVTGYSNADGEWVKAGIATLYAQWTPKTYTVTFVKNDELATGTMTAQNFVYGAAPEGLTTNAFAKTGYTFEGWATTSTGTVAYANEGEYQVDATNPDNITLHAVWAPINYEIAFDGNTNTEGSMTNLPMVYDEPENLTTNAYAKTGYTFGGWNTVASGVGGDAYINGAEVSNLTTEDGATVTLFAQWTANTYTVTFHKNDDLATGSMGVQSFTYDQAQNLTAEGFDKEGYTFDGWATSEGGAKVYNNVQDVSNLTTVPGGNVDLYAVWKANTYTVVFYKNDGAEVQESTSQTFTYDAEPTALNPNTFVRDGYVFTGWALHADATVSYADEAEVRNLTSVANGMVYFYAVWVQEFTLTFNPNDGTLGDDESSRIIRYETQIGALPTNPSRGGYSFNGWKIGEDVISATTVWNYTSDQEAMAQWTLDNPTVTISSSGSSVTYGTNVTLTAVPTHGASTATYTYQWYKGGVAITDATNETLTLTDVVESGTYTVKVIATVDGATTDEVESAGEVVTIAPATLTVTANNNTKVYNTTDPTLDYTVGATQYSETANFSGSIERVTGEDVGTYAINQGTLALSDAGTFLASNYSLSFTAGEFTITQATNAITDMSVADVTYGTPITLTEGTATFGTITYNYSGTTTGGTSYNSATAPTAAGTYTVTGTVTATVNYAGASATDGFVITPATLTVTANNNTKVYSAVDPTLDYTVGATQYSETANFSGSIERVAGEDIGDYAINQGTLVLADQGDFLASNYTLSFTAGTFTITQATNAITDMSVADVTYGTSITLTEGAATFGTITYNYSGTTTGGTSYNSATAPTAVGTYTVTGTVVATVNYAGATATDDFEITPKAATVDIDDQTIVKGMPFPTYTATITGVVVGESIIPVYEDGIDNTLTADTYTITMTNEEDYPNYDITVYNGVLTITAGYTLTFDANGGTEIGDITDVAHGSTVAAPTSSKTGYTLTGWTPAFEPVVTEDADYTAQWTANTYYVRYNENGTGVTGEMSNQTFTYDAELTPLTENAYIREGFVFKGWATSPEGAVVYQNEEPVRNLSIHPGAIIDLYAVWLQEFTLTWDANHGTTDETSRIVILEQPVGELPAEPVRTGFEFAGWFIGTVEITATTVWTYEEDMTAVAHYFRAEESKISCFEANDGEITVTASPDVELPYMITLKKGGASVGTITGTDRVFAALEPATYTVNAAGNAMEVIVTEALPFEVATLTAAPYQYGQEVVIAAYGAEDCTWTPETVIPIQGNNIVAVKLFEPITTVTVTGNDQGCVVTQSLTFNVEACPATATDVHENEYKVGAFAGQCWFRENLKATQYADESLIPFANVYHHSDAEYTQDFGRIYDIASALRIEETAEVNTNTLQGACPDGWRLPTGNELAQLGLYYTSDELRSETFWVDGGGQCDEENGFNALPAGFYNGDTRRYEKMYTFTGFWSSTMTEDGDVIYGQLTCYCGEFEMKNIRVSAVKGLSVRCVKAVESQAVTISGVANEDNTATFTGYAVAADSQVATVAFQYRLAGDASWTTLEASAAEGAQIFSATTTPLTAGTYEFKAIMTAGDFQYEGMVQQVIVD